MRSDFRLFGFLASPRCWMAIFALGVIGVHDASGQNVAALRIKIQENRTNAPVVGASVYVGRTTAGITNTLGFVSFAAIPLGEHRIYVRALGYENRELLVGVEGDTSLIVVLETQAIPLDALVGTSKTFTLLAEVRGRDNDRGVPGAPVFIGSHNARTDGVGIFQIRNLVVGDTMPLLIHSVGYLPFGTTVTASGDTTMRVYLELDPVAQAMIKAQLERLDDRVQGVNAPLRKIDRAHLLRHATGTLLETLHFLDVSRRFGCIVVDNRVRSEGMGYLNRFMPEEIERVEIIGRASKIRIFTYEYVRNELPKLEHLPTVTTGICR